MGSIVLAGYRVGRRTEYGKDVETRGEVGTGSEMDRLAFHPGNAEWAVMPP
jgi:hypothetical protein